VQAVSTGNLTHRKKDTSGWPAAFCLTSSYLRMPLTFQSDIWALPMLLGYRCI